MNRYGTDPITRFSRNKRREKKDPDDSLLDGGGEVDGVAELRERHVELVHGGEVLPRLPVASVLNPKLLN